MSLDLEHHFCERDEGWAEYDSRGIYLTFVCEICVDAKLAKYRKEVLTNSNYWSHEDIEESQ